MLRDLDSQAWVKLQAAAETCRRLFALRGYSRIDTPLLEDTDLFLRKSGGELASRLYSFTDPGGYAVSIRPEFTAPVIRHVLEHVGLDVLPLRFEYSGPVFRYPSPGTPAEGEPGVFMQAGAELIGGPSPRGDGEIIGMAWAGLRELGAARPGIVLGHVGLMWDLLRLFGLSDRARLFLVNGVGDLARGDQASVRNRAIDLGLLADVAGVKGQADRSDADRASADLVQSVLRHGLGASFTGATGVRTTQEIVARLAQKMRASDDPKSVEAALDLLATLSVVKGPVGAATKEGRAVARAAGQDETPFDAVDGIIDAAVGEGVPEDAITVDFGLARGIAYYTGAVFELVRGDQGASLGGGGRYDGLLRALGADRDVPALGFAYNLDAVVDAAGSAALTTNEGAVVVAPASAGAEGAARERATVLRSEAVIAIVELSPRSRDDVRAYARSVGATEIEYVGADDAIESENL